MTLNIDIDALLTEILKIKRLATDIITECSFDKSIKESIASLRLGIINIIEIFPQTILTTDAISVTYLKVFRKCIINLMDCQNILNTNLFSENFNY